MPQSPSPGESSGSGVGSGLSGSDPAGHAGPESRRATSSPSLSRFSTGIPVCGGETGLLQLPLGPWSIALVAER